MGKIVIIFTLIVCLYVGWSEYRINQERFQEAVSNSPKFEECIGSTLSSFIWVRNCSK